MSSHHQMKYGRRNTHQPALRVRNDALIIGPGGELVEAHAAGDLEPAIPKPIVGRIPANPETIVHEPPGTVVGYSVIVGFTPISGSPTAASPPGITAEGILTTNLPQQSPAPGAVSSTAFLIGQSPSPISSVSFSATTSSGLTSSTSLASTSSSPTTVLSQPFSATTASNSIPPAPTADSSSPHSDHYSSLNVAIAFAVLAAIGFIVAIVAWFLRVRARSHRRQVTNRTSWPWDRDDRQLEDGCRTDFNNCQVGEKELSVHSVLPLPPGLIGRDTIMHDSHYVSMPQSPYRLVSGAMQQSVPDLVQDMGALRVANYVPGDSRATSRLGTLGGHRSTTNGSNISLDDFGMLKHPWPSTRFHSDASSLGLGTRDEKIDPYYLSSHVGSEATTKGSPPDNWLSSLRSNFFSAFQAVVGGTPNPASKSDHYTSEPVRVSPTRQRISGQAISRQGSSVHSQNVLSPQNSTAGHAVNLSNQSTWLSDASNRRDNSNISVPPLAIVKNRDRQEGTLSRASSVYSTSSARCSVHASTQGFGLPQIPMSRSGSMSSLQQAFRGDDQEVYSNALSAPKRDRAYTTSARSMMTALSRTTSSHSEAMTEEEQLAGSILKERRKRISDLGEAVDSIGRPQHE